MGQIALANEEALSTAMAVVVAFGHDSLTDTQREEFFRELSEFLRPHLIRVLVRYEHELIRLGKLRPAPPNQTPELET